MSRKLSGKNLFKATIFYPYSNDNTPLHPSQEGNYDNTPLNKGGLRGVLCFFKIGWLARLKGYKVSLEKLFQHICLTNSLEIMQPGG